MIQGYEWLIILAIVILIFGVGRISKIGNEFGKAISAFREGVAEGREEDEEKTAEQKES